MDYWKRRELQQQLRLYNLTEKQITELLRAEYLRLYKEVSDRLEALVASFTKDSTVNELYKQNKMWDLIKELEYKLNELGNIEINNLTNTFSDYYVENYNLVGTVNIPIDNNRVLNAINAVWAGDGQMFSDRIWKSKRAMIEKLRIGLINTVSTGSNWGEFSKELKNTFGVTYNEARRLVRTELTHIQTESTIQKYKAEGVEKVRYIAEMDACPDCLKMKDKLFYIDKAPIIPVHPNCRCTYIAVIEE